MGMGIAAPVAPCTANELVELDRQPKKKLAPTASSTDGFSRMSSDGVQLILGFLAPTDRASLLATQRKLHSEPLATSIQSYCGACAQCTAQNEHLCESSASEVDRQLFWKSVLERRTNSLGLCQLRLANCPAFVKSLLAFTNTKSLTNALQNLRVLDLKRCVGVDADTLRTLASACGNLHELRLRDMTLDADAFQQLVSLNQHSLRVVDLEGCHTLTGPDVLALSKCRRLTRLSLAGCHNIDPAVIASIVRACNQLTSLNLRFCHQIDDPLVHTIAAARPQLEELSLRYCMKITDAAVRAIGDALPRLTTLDLSQCSKITDAGVGHIVANLKALKNLRLWACGKLTTAAVHAILEASPSLELVDIRSRNRLEAVIGGRDGLQLLARKRTRRWEHGEQFGVFKRPPMCAVAA